MRWCGRWSAFWGRLVLVRCLTYGHLLPLCGFSVGCVGRGRVVGRLWDLVLGGLLGRGSGGEGLPSGAARGAGMAPPAVEARACAHVIILWSWLECSTAKASILKPYLEIVGARPTTSRSSAISDACCSSGTGVGLDFSFSFGGKRVCFVPLLWLSHLPGDNITRHL